MGLLKIQSWEHSYLIFSSVTLAHKVGVVLMKLADNTKLRGITISQRNNWNEGRIRCP